jgi:hypothetical protein
VTDTKYDAAMDAAVSDMQRDADRATKLMNADPSLPFISALVMARDLASADRSMEWLREGKHPWSRAEVFCGSYGRLDLRVRAWQEGLITDEQALDGLADAWSGSDPDDTDPRFLALWKTAFATNGGTYLRDHADATLPGTQWLTIYRGQDAGALFGIAWSLDFKVALKFANGAATRQRNRGGVVYRAIVDRTKVMGYMTGRGEKEVIVDPADLVMVERP